MDEFEFTQDTTVVESFNPEVCLFSEDYRCTLGKNKSYPDTDFLPLYINRLRASRLKRPPSHI